MPKLNNKELALVALLSNPSVKEAAAACNLSERTLFRFLSDDGFKSEYRDARRAIVETAIAAMQNGASEAVARLRELQYSENPAAAVRSAQIIYESAIKGVEVLDLAERLEVLEDEFTKQVVAATKQNRSRS
jgi:DNA-binding MurR/RpiR family transcriptional regulator